MIVQTKKIDGKWFAKAVTKKFKGPWNGPHETEEEAIDAVRLAWRISKGMGA